jgi:hypothetical protein
MSYSTTIIPSDYEARLAKYNHEVEVLAEKRRKFYEENPDFWCKTMYINVCAPPQKIEIREIK